MLKPIPFEAKHIFGLWGAAERDQMTEHKLIEYAVTYEQHPAVSFVDGEKLVACGGLVIPWPGLAEAWLRAIPDCERYRVGLFRLSKRALEMNIRGLKLRRVEATLNSAFAPGIRWAEHLGFWKESELPNFGPRGETFLKYVRWGY